MINNPEIGGVRFSTISYLYLLIRVLTLTALWIVPRLVELDSPNGWSPRLTAIAAFSGLFILISFAYSQTYLRWWLKEIYNEVRPNPLQLFSMALFHFVRTNEKKEYTTRYGLKSSYYNILFMTESKEIVLYDREDDTYPMTEFTRQKLEWHHKFEKLDGVTGPMDEFYIILDSSKEPVVSTDQGVASWLLLNSEEDADITEAEGAEIGVIYREALDDFYRTTSKEEVFLQLIHPGRRSKFWFSGEELLLNRTQGFKELKAVRRERAHQARLKSGKKH